MANPHQHRPPRVLTVFSLTMITIIAIDSLRNIPAAAENGFSLVFYYLAAAVLFFIPSALICAELATGWSERGGVYAWVREAFGVHWGFLAIWLQWVMVVLWYPLIVSFIAATLLYIINPAFAENKHILLPTMLVIFWGATALNVLGMRVSSFVSSLTAILGTAFPMVLMTILCIIWLITGHKSQVNFSWHHFWPNLHYSSIAYMIAVFVSLTGIELCAAHATEVKDPQRSYPRAIWIATTFIVVSLTLTSLSMAVVMPKSHIRLVEGLVAGFHDYFKVFHLSWMTPVMALMLIFGGFGTASAWIIGPSKGLLVAAEEYNLPKILRRTNAKGVPTNILWLQAIIFTLLCALFLYMPTVNSSYWILMVLFTQMHMLMYILVFMAAIRLRYTEPDVVRSYRIPGGNWGMWSVSGLAIVVSALCTVVGFIPPGGMHIGTVNSYETILIVGFIILGVLPLLGSYLRKP